MKNTIAVVQSTGWSSALPSKICFLSLRRCARFLAVVAALLVCTHVSAQEKTPYAAMGAPVSPKVVVHWNRYHDYQQSTEILQQLAKEYPDFARLESLGKSYGGREMWVMTISDFKQGRELEKPAFWIDGGIHANEIQSVEVVLYTAWYLLEMQAESDLIARLLDQRVFYLMPMMSPDSRDAHFYRPNTTHSPRSGQRPVDDDRDGLVDEDGPDDLDGDGNITQMRIADKNGRYRVHPDYPNLLVATKEREQGEYTLLGSEGIDNDGDGEVNEDGDGYYDPNRNWPWFWQPEYIQGGAHNYPLSIAEDRMVADFIIAHPNIAAGQSYHNAGGMILRGPGAKVDSFEQSDTRVYDAIGKQGEAMLPGYRYMNVANDLYEVWGGEIDWLHQMRGAYVFTNELFPAFNFFRRASGSGYFASDEDRQLFDRYLLFEEGASAWKEVDHPQYGKVEVGGLKKTWIRQPPSFLLEEECHRNMAFTLYHADEMPLVRVQNVDVQELSDNLFQVTAVLANEKLIPTRSAADVNRKITPPDIAEISGGDIQVLVGSVSSDQFFREPKEQKRRPAKLRLDRIPDRGAMYVRWLVQGRGPYTVTITSVKGGVASKKSDE